MPIQDQSFLRTYKLGFSETYHGAVDLHGYPFLLSSTTTQIVGPLVNPHPHASCC